MKAITPEIESEAAIYAEGTPYTKGDILKAYRGHIAVWQGVSAEPLDIQRFCEDVLGIAAE